MKIGAKYFVVTRHWLPVACLPTALIIVAFLTSGLITDLTSEAPGA